jgi:hypothetical protein
MNPRPCWRNCCVDPGDPEISRIDAMEDALKPLPAELRAIRRLITSLEMCHHKAERWVSLIIEAIAEGRTSKGPGTRPKGSRHPAEVDWQNCVRVLSDWCAGVTAPVEVKVGDTWELQLKSALGEPTDLRKWQVRRVIDKVRSFTEPGSRYAEIVENPNHSAEDEKFREATLSALIRDKVDGQPAEISLAAAIGHLEPCHWNFVGNLMIVLNAIGGDLSPSHPYAACGRNIKLSPLRPRMKKVVNTLRSFWTDTSETASADDAILDRLGTKTPEKQWLVASLDKTIRHQFGL